MRRTQWTVLAFVVAACSGCHSGQQKEQVASVRLNPASFGQTAAELAALTDRDTTTQVRLPGVVRLTARFDTPVRVTAVKAFGLHAAHIEAGGRRIEPGAVEEEWRRALLDPGEARSTFDITLVPEGSDASIGELEIWGLGRPGAPHALSAQVVADATGFENLVRVDAVPSSAKLEVGSGSSCANFAFELPRDARTVRRASLTYRGQGLKRAAVLRRSLNGFAAAGGFWMGATEVPRVVVDELNPRQLETRNQVLLCLPDDATGDVALEAVALVVELDDGTNLLDRDSQAIAAEAWDADGRTSRSVRELELGFLSRMQLDRAWLNLDGAAAELESVELADRLGPMSLPSPGKVGPGLVRLDLGDAVAAGESIHLKFAGAQRADLPSVFVAELGLAGSPLGRFGGVPRLVVTYPTDGEHFGTAAYVSGFVDGAAALSGPVEVSVDGEVVPGGASFGKRLERAASASPWRVQLQARLADGTVLERTLVLDQDHTAELTSDEDMGAVGAQAADLMFGALDEIASAAIGPAGGEVRLGQRVRLVVPEGAVAANTVLSIQRRASTSVPPLDPALVNVTAPAGAGYRFTPPGKQFQKPVRVHLPYELALLPDGTPPEEIRTYYYDESLKRWEALPRVGV
ncbi:MAG: hypothetical protein ACYC8T_31250, partial [Myxococcaceae bacterium]